MIRRLLGTGTMKKQTSKPVMAALLLPRYDMINTGTMKPILYNWFY
jgi:hypothetical protein